MNVLFLHVSRLNPKYNRVGGQVDVAVQAVPGDAIRFEVADTGRGIADELVGELFQPFNRLAAERGPIEGTGIGLAISHGLVAMMKGELRVSTRLGEGSRFWFELTGSSRVGLHGGPVGPESSAVAAVSPLDAPVTHVLYVEDNPVNMRLVKQMLARMPGVRLIPAGSPVEGIDLARRRRPDLILLDINMPGMDGYEVLAVLKADPGLVNIPVLAVTANAMPRDIERGRAAGFVDYLTKPLDIALFQETVGFWLKRKPGR